MKKYDFIRILQQSCHLNEFKETKFISGKPIFLSFRKAQISDIFRNLSLSVALYNKFALILRLKISNQNVSDWLKQSESEIVNSQTAINVEKIHESSMAFCKTWKNHGMAVGMAIYEPWMHNGVRFMSVQFGSTMNCQNSLRNRQSTKYLN